MRPHCTGAYVNFLMQEDPNRLREVYGAGRYQRLQALKGAWDPHNVFRRNQNIPPP